MTKKRLVSLFTAIVLALPLLSSAPLTTVSAQPAVFDAVEEPTPEDNLVPEWSFDDEQSVANWKIKKQKLTYH